MVNDPKQIQLKMESLRKEYEELKKEIEILHHEIQAKLEKGDNIGDLAKIEHEKFKRASSLLEEFHLLIKSSIKIKS